MEDYTGVPVTRRVGGVERLGDYEILAVAGRGGMGLVYRARQCSLGRVVALKVIRDEVASAPEYRERFMLEPRLAASVDHPHIVSVYEVGEERGQLFLAMQWIEGEDLRSEIERRGRLAPERAVRIVTQVAGALHAVHSTSGLIHRDVKPANVLIRQVRGGDHAYLTDFGIAKMTGGEQLTRTGGLVGTPGYLSPEQIRGSDPGPRSDLYALGCVLYEALTGQRPFRGDSDIALMWAHANDPRPVPSAVVAELGGRYDHFMSIALAIDPDQRFESGEAFADALDDLHPTNPVPRFTSPPLPIIVGPDTPIPPAQSTAYPAATTAQSPPAADPPTGVGGAHPPRSPAPAPTPPYAPPPPPVGYPPYGYVTPPPAPPASSTSGNRLAVILFGLIAVAGIAVGAIAVGGAFSHKASTQTITQLSTGAPPSSSGSVAPSASTSGSSAATPSSGGAGPGITSCAGGLSIGANTSCGFAENVEEAYDQSAGGAQVVTAYSPATGRTYTIDCTGGPAVVCTGGSTVGASIYFTYAPAAQTGTGSSGSLSACDANISVNAVTSCAFATNVFKAYAQQYQGDGGQGNAAVTAYSPVTGQTYRMSCTDNGGTVTCTGGTNSYVTFPLHAAQVY